MSYPQHLSTAWGRASPTPNQVFRGLLACMTALQNHTLMQRKRCPFSGEGSPMAHPAGNHNQDFSTHSHSTFPQVTPWAKPRTFVQCTNCTSVHGIPEHRECSEYVSKLNPCSRETYYGFPNHLVYKCQVSTLFLYRFSLTGLYTVNQAFWKPQPQTKYQTTVIYLHLLWRHTQNPKGRNLLRILETLRFLDSCLAFARSSYNSPTPSTAVARESGHAASGEF